jgi:hypothetical protein
VWFGFLPANGNSPKIIEAVSGKGMGNTITSMPMTQHFGIRTTDEAIIPA